MANEYTGDDNQEDERTQAVFPLDDQMNIPPLNMPALHDGSTFDAEPSGLAGLVQETQAKRQADAASAQTQESQETQAFDPLAELDDEAAPEPQPGAPHSRASSYSWRWGHMSDNRLLPPPGNV